MRITQHGEDTLAFEPDSHTYWLNQHLIPSVSSVLSGGGHAFRGKPGREGFGHSVHDAITDFETLALEPIDEEVKAHVEAWKEFYRLYLPSWDSIEKPVWSKKNWYAGTLDRAGFIRAQRVIVDVKSGSKSKSHIAQIGLYALAWNELFPEDPIQGGFVVYTKRLSVQPVEIEAAIAEGLQTLGRYKA